MFCINRTEESGVIKNLINTKLGILLATRRVLFESKITRRRLWNSKSCLIRCRRIGPLREQKLRRADRKEHFLVRFVLSIVVQTG